MTFNWIFRCALLPVSVGLMVTACNTADSSSSHDKTVSKGDYVKTSKPGAAVQFENISGLSSTGTDTRTVRVRIFDKYSAGTLTVEMAPSENLNVSAAANVFVFDMAGSDFHEISATVKPLSDGRHFLNFTAIAEYGEGQVARSYYAVPVYSNVTAKTFNDTIRKKSGTVENGVIVMDAEETITRE